MQKKERTTDTTKNENAGKSTTVEMQKARIDAFPAGGPTRKFYFSVARPLAKIRACLSLDQTGQADLIFGFSDACFSKNLFLSLCLLVAFRIFSLAKSKSRCVCVRERERERERECVCVH
jgi:hypothetical protein